MFRNPHKLVTFAGILLLFLTLVWWQQSFGFSLDHIKCFVFSGGDCQVNAAVKLFGGIGYKPKIFWIGLVCLVAGFVLKKIRHW